MVGLGGVFLKAGDRVASRAFYRSLGLPLGEQDHFTWSWGPSAKGRGRARLGYTVFSLFAADTGYFGASGQPFMLNLRVEGLDALLTRLRKAGVTVLPERQEEPYGRFAWVLDPDGHRVELWEPSRQAAHDAVAMR